MEDTWTAGGGTFMTTGCCIMYGYCIGMPIMGICIGICIGMAPYCWNPETGTTAKGSEGAVSGT